MSENNNQGNGVFYPPLIFVPVNADEEVKEPESLNLANVALKIKGQLS